MRLAITGHRPEKLTLPLGRIALHIGQVYEDLNPEFIYEGQAPGIDLIAALAAWRGKIPYEAVLPFAGHRSMMKTAFWQDMWSTAGSHAERVEVLSDSETYPGHWCMHNRNRYMVDHADEVLAVWDGGESGGTWSTVKYARSKKKPVHILNPNTLEFTIATD